MPRVEWPITLYDSVISYYESIDDKEQQDKMAVAIMRWLSGDDNPKIVEFFNSSLNGRRIFKDLRKAVNYSKKKCAADQKKYAVDIDNVVEPKDPGGE